MLNRWYRNLKTPTKYVVAIFGTLFFFLFAALGHQKVVVPSYGETAGYTFVGVVLAVFATLVILINTRSKR